MRKVLFIWALFLGILPSIAQEISMDKTKQDGSRTIITKNDWIKTSLPDKSIMGFSLCYHSSPEGKETYRIILALNSTKRHNMMEKGLLLLKTSRNEVIEGQEDVLSYLPSDNAKEVKVRKVKLKLNKIRMAYHIAYDDLKKIATDGVIKSRFETVTGYVDMEYTPKQMEEIKELISSHLQCLEEARKTSSDIRAGF